MNKELVQDIIQWDVKSWAKALSYWDKNIDWSKAQNCLELGGREGGLSLWMALKNKKVICSDYSEVEKTASQLHNKHGITSLITYQNIDAADIPYENYFDVIIFKSILGVIGRDNNKQQQAKVIDQIYKALKPGGKLLFAENMIGSPVHRLLRRRFVKWGNIWRYISLDEMQSFLKQFKNYDLKTTGVVSLFGRSEEQRNALATIDKFLDHIIPDNYKYIVYGMAEK